jgi:hypothetical protein
MAFLFRQSSATKCYLYAHHSFGRFVYSVDTLISDPSVSKIHAIIEWQDQQWTIRDFSRNGTWLNNVLLNKDQESALTLNDCIAMTPDGENNFIVKDLSPPCDLLIPCTNNVDNEAIELKPYHFLPSEESAELAVIFNNDTSCWHVENINNKNNHSFLLEDNGFVEFNHQRWQFKLSHLEKETSKNNRPHSSINDCTFIFDLSPDEEITHLKLQSFDNSIDLQARNHHYLTLNLARHKVDDMNNGIKEELQGWVDTDRLCRDLGIDIYHINLQIHRVRKQFSELESDFLRVANIIERRKGQVRFTGAIFEVYKNRQLELSIKNNRVICQN